MYWAAILVLRSSVLLASSSTTACWLAPGKVFASEARFIVKHQLWELEYSKALKCTFFGTRKNHVAQNLCNLRSSVLLASSSATACWLAPGKVFASEAFFIVKHQLRELEYSKALRCTFFGTRKTRVAQNSCNLSYELLFCHSFELHSWFPPPASMPEIALCEKIEKICSIKGLSLKIFFDFRLTAE